MVVRGTGSLVVLVVVFLSAPSLQAHFEGKLPDQINQESRIIDLKTESSEPPFAGIHQFPWQVLVITEKPNEEGVDQTRLCGGSIIHSQWIMSAAHCFVKSKYDNEKPDGFTINANRIRLYVGIIDRTNFAGTGMPVNDYDRKEIRATGDEQLVFIHEDYNTVTMTNNDITLFKLKNQLNLDGPSAKLIPRATTDDFIPGKMLTASGWGLMSKSGKINPPYLRFVTDMKLRSRIFCDENISGMTDKMICQISNTEQKATFTGDSGGPVIIGRDGSSGPTYVQIGIVSRDYVDDKVKFASVFTDVAKFETWISKKMTGNTISVCNSRNDDGTCQNADGPTCDDVGGTCLPRKRAQKKCKGKIDETFECVEKGKVCCINGCPEEQGFFFLPASRQCFKLMPDSGGVNWYEAKLLCEEKGLRMAEPHDIVAVRSWVSQAYGNPWCWLGAKGNGNDFVWNSGEILSSTIKLWYQHLAPNPFTTQCVILLQDKSDTHDYYIDEWSCSLRDNPIRIALCELLL